MRLKFPFELINETLRHQAEQLLLRIADNDDSTEPHSDSAVRAMLHELQVHQVELELQNEELRETQVKLAHMRDQYRALYDYAPVAYITVDSDGIITESNHKSRLLLGSDGDSSPINGKRLSSYIASNSQDELHIHLYNVFKVPTKQYALLNLHHNDSDKKTIVRAESSLLPADNAQNLFCHMALIDLSEIYGAKERLKYTNKILEEQVTQRTCEIKESRDHLQAILDAAADAIITINKHGIIDSINASTETMFGYQHKSELLGKNIAMLMPEPHASRHHAYILRYMVTNNAKLIGKARELMAKRKDGSLFNISLSVSQIDHTDQFIGIIRDNSSRIALEKQALSRAEEERNRIGRELHDSVSQAISGLNMKASCLSSIAANWDDKLATLFNSFSQDLKNTISEIRHIVNNLSPVNFEESSFKDVFSHLVVTNQKYTDAAIILDCQSEGVEVDNTVALQLYRIAQEALCNAIKYSGATLIKVAIESSKHHLCLTIQDNGRGFAIDKHLDNHRPVNTNHGINNMKYRASVIGAQFVIHSDLELGTEIQCIIKKITT